MVNPQYKINVDLGKELYLMTQKRAKQEGITVSEYIREAVLVEMVTSGDVEAIKFVSKRVSKRVVEMLVDKLSGVDLKRQVGALQAG